MSVTFDYGVPLSFGDRRDPKTGRALGWFELPKGDDVGRAVIETVKDIELRQVSIFSGNQRHARLYAGYLPVGLNWVTGPGMMQRQPFAATKALIRSICDTATAIISRFRPKPSFITTGADWDVQRQAEDMEIFMGGAYERSDIYRVSQRSFHDSTVFGTGLWKYVPRGEGSDWHVKCERVLPDDFVVDEEECRDTLEPANTYHRMMVKSDALIRKYASGNSKEDQALRMKIAAATSHTSWPNRALPRDRLILVEAIHLGDKPRRVLAIEGATLVDEEWPYDFHPYEVLWWAPPLSGFYGDGVAYRQFGRQERLTYLYRWIEKVQNYYSTPTAWVDPAGGPPVYQITNEIGAVIQTRKPPQFQQHQAVPQEIYRWVDELARGGYEDEGISQTTATNTLPAGLESAPAQREYSFKESNRFAPVSQRWEDALAGNSGAPRKMIAMYRRRAMTTNEKPGVKWANRGILHSVEWPDLEENAYHIRAEASSLETLSPASRLQAAIELSQTNWLRPGEGRRLLGHPDLEHSDQLDNAPFDYAEMVFKRLIKGEMVEVDELADLNILDSTVRAGRLWAITRKAPPNLIANCSDFLERLDKVKADAAAAAMQQMGVPGPAPTSTPVVPTGPMSTAAAQGMPMPFAGGKGR